MSNNVTIKPETNKVELTDQRRNVTVTDNRTGTSINLTQTDPAVLLINTPGPQGNSAIGTASGSFSGSFQGDGSGLTGLVASGSIDSASFASSGDGIFSGSFSGSFEGDGSNLTGVASPTGSYTGSFTGSLLGDLIGTASYAISASHEITYELSSSLAETASFARSGDGIFSGSFFGDLIGTSSFSLTSSYIDVNNIGNLTSGSYIESFNNSSTWNVQHNLNSSFVTIQVYDTDQEQVIPATIDLIDANNATISFDGISFSGTAIVTIGRPLATSEGSTTASFADRATSASIADELSQLATASFANNSISSSYALTASYVLNSQTIDTGSLATTGSNTFIGEQTISGSVNISGSISISTAEDGELIIGSNGIITATLGDITIEPFDDLLLYGGDSLIATNEGGDVVLRAGVGPDEVDSVISTGGDVTIAGGNGGSGSIDSGGNGGNVTIYGGDSQTEAIGGTVRIYGGFGYNNYGSVFIGTAGPNEVEFNQNSGELLGPFWTIDRGTIYLDTSTQDQKIYFGTSNTASFIGTNFGDFKLYNSGSNLEIESENVNITGSLFISGSGSLNGDNIISSNTIQKIETITSASYAGLTPVSGTLYIIID